MSKNKFGLIINTTTINIIEKKIFFESLWLRKFMNLKAK